MQEGAEILLLATHVCIRDKFSAILCKSTSAQTVESDKFGSALSHGARPHLGRVWPRETSYRHELRIRTLKETHPVPSNNHDWMTVFLSDCRLQQPSAHTPASNQEHSISRRSVFVRSLIASLPSRPPWHAVFSFPGHSQILYRSRCLHSCEIKSGSGLGTIAANTVL